MDWSIEKVVALAPNVGAEQRGRALASPSKWLSYGRNDRALWGECKGSGQEPYRTHIDTQNLAFGCTCPTREHPCKHALGLLFLQAQFPQTIATAAPPAWVQTWLDKRSARQKSAESTTPKTEIDSEERRRRQAQRFEQIESALAVFEQWMLDAVQQGAAQLPVHDDAFWDRAAAQLTDAKLPRLRLSVKRTALHIQHQSEWTDYLLQRLGEWNSLVQATRHREQLPPLLQEDLLNALGQTIYKKDVLAQGERLLDRWHVLGKDEGENLDGVPFRQVWLYGEQSGRYALLLDYKFGDQNYEHFFVVGSAFDAALSFYISNYPQRAVIEQFILAELPPADWKAGFDSFAACLHAYAQALARNPWLEDFPVVLRRVVPLTQQKRFFLMDEAHRLLELNPQFSDIFWQLMAQSAGHPITLFGTYNGAVLDPYSIFIHGRWVELV